MFKEEITQYCPMCQEWVEKYEKLEAENEELNFVNEKLKAENMEYFRSINDINKRIDKYENALREIKETIQNRLNLVCNDCMLKQCEYCDANKILQKINEVE